MSSNTHNSDAEAERAGIKKTSREASLRNPKVIKGALKALVLGLKIWRVAAKLWEWFS